MPEHIYDKGYKLSLIHIYSVRPITTLGRMCRLKAGRSPGPPLVFIPFPAGRTTTWPTVITTVPAQPPLWSTVQAARWKRSLFIRFLPITRDGWLGMEGIKLLSEYQHRVEQDALPVSYTHLAVLFLLSGYEP